MLFSPLEQFEVKPLILFEIGNFDISFSNSALSMVIVIMAVLSMVVFTTSNGATIVPSRWQSVIEMIYEFILGMVKETIGKKGMPYFPFVFTLFMFILFCNLLGLIPYSFTATSHIIVTFTLALSIFIAATILGFYHHGFNFLGFFFPEGVTVAIAPLLVPIELLSYFARPMSLSIRLFANIMAGHLLFHIMAGFSWTMLGMSSAIYILGFLPIAFLVLLTGLEIFICFIQAYVFTILSVNYLNDGIHSH